MFMEDPATSFATRDIGTSGTVADDQNLVFALQLPIQNTRKDSTSQTDMIKDLPASMQGESRFQQRKNGDKALGEEDKWIIWCCFTKKDWCIEAPYIQGNVTTTTFLKVMGQVL